MKERGATLKMILCAFVVLSVVSRTTFSIPLLINEQAPPLIVVEPELETPFEEGKTAVLRCEASGTPTPKYSWTKNGEDYDPDEDDDVTMDNRFGTLTFSNVQEEHDAIYRCLATNKNGVAMSQPAALKKTHLSNFWHEPPRKHFVSVGRSLTLYCSSPFGYPLPNTVWKLYDEHTDTYHEVEISQRVTMTPSHNLLFTHITWDDYADGMEYRCVADNGYFQRVAPGNSIIPQDNNRPPFGPFSHWWPAPGYTAVLGRSFSTQCVFTGMPTPEIDWTAEGGMPDGVVIQDFGHEIFIKEVSFEHAATYQCTGYSPQDDLEDPITHAFELTVEAAPSWTQEPMPVKVVTGQTAVVTCETHATPEADVIWYLDGTPITELPPDERISYDNSQLVIRDVTMRDQQGVQCEVSNKHGDLYASTYINVRPNWQEFFGGIVGDN